MARLPGHLTRRGNGWRYIVRVNGTRHTFGPRSEPVLRLFKTRNEVEEWAWAKLDELKEAAKREAEDRPETIRFSELIERFREQELPTLAPGTQDAYEDTLKPIEEFFVEGEGDPTVDRIRRRDIKGYLSWRRVNRRGGKSGKPLSNRTLNKDRAVLHRIFRWADEDLEVREGNPVARVNALKVDGHDPTILSDEEYDRLLAECRKSGPMLGLYALVLGETGVRAYSEALWLRWEDVDLDGGFLKVASGRDGHRTKSGKARWVLMTRRLRDAMREHFARFRLVTYEGERSPWIFHHRRRRRGAAAGERVKDYRTSFDTAAERAKLPDGFRRHDLRHRRVTTWLGEGKSPALVQEAMGHSDPRVTAAYTHLSREHLLDLVEDEDPAVEEQKDVTA